MTHDDHHRIELLTWGLKPYGDFKQAYEFNFFMMIYPRAGSRGNGPINCLRHSSHYVVDRQILAVLGSVYGTPHELDSVGSIGKIALPMTLGLVIAPAPSSLSLQWG